MRQSSPYRRWGLMRKFSIDRLDASKIQQLNSASIDPPLPRSKEKSRNGNSVSTLHCQCRHRLRTPFLRTPFPRVLETSLRTDNPQCFGISNRTNLEIEIRNGQSMAGGPKWTKRDVFQAQTDQNGPFWSILVSRMLKSSSE